MKPENTIEIRSLSPAAWYLYSPLKEKVEGGRGQVSRLYATKEEAEEAMAMLFSPPHFDMFSHRNMS